MPVAWAVVAKLSLVLAILLTIIAFIRWALKRAEDKQRAEDQVAELKANLARSEAARKKEREIADAARKVRDAPGPRVPTLDELRGPPAGPGAPPGTTPA